MEIRVAIFEDNKLVRDALQTILNGTPGYACSGAFTDGNRWDQDIRRSNPDVILMDIEMPGLNGIEITKRITEKFPEIKILIQTVFNDSDKIFNALCAGASGYILKSDPPHKYLEAINEVYNGGAPITSTIAKKILQMFPKTPARSSEADKLSAREQEILQLLMKGYSYKMIAPELKITLETVRTHIKRIYEKLHVHSASEAIAKIFPDRRL